MSDEDFDRQTKILIETFDKLSSTYKNKFTTDSNEKIKLQSLVDSWGIKGGSIVLEVGGGTGDLSPYILKKIGKNGKLVFLDISPKMIKKARGKLRNYNNIDFICGDAVDFDSFHVFDTVVVFNTFPHFINKEKTLCHFYKILKKGGSLIISHNNSRWGIFGHHRRKAIENIVSDFPQDKVVFNMLKETGYDIEIFENNEGYDYYLVVSKKR